MSSTVGFRINTIAVECGWRLVDTGMAPRIGLVVLMTVQKQRFLWFAGFWMMGLWYVGAKMKKKR